MIAPPKSTDPRVSLFAVTSHDPELLASRLGVCDNSRAEVVRLFREVYELIAEIKDLSLPALPLGPSRKLASALQRLDLSLQEIESFRSQHHHCEEWERCILLDQVQERYEEIQQILVCPF